MHGISCYRDQSVLRIVLDRPDKLNALNTPMLEELKARVGDARDDSVRVVVLTGAGRGFCSGGDLTGADTDGAVVVANEVVQAIAALPKPVVAGVHGAAVGLGCPLALACDLVVAARSAFFQLAFTKVGLMPDGGACALVPAAIGRARAARMAMLAEKIAAPTAFEWGMISHVVDDVNYETELAAVVQKLASGPTMAYRWLKQALSEATLSALPGVGQLEVEGQTALTRTADFLEGVRAFVKRRSPEFQGR
ncbi:crotonase [Mycobacterium heckeshornense]|uniref:Enoyl-CoA hydratase n=1 Tax=Mycobacterium heckeshornense TaxID=110505 RepID=A0A2G8B4M1_9MYCO|nr:enoyl-CoA hydratase-related protein [Mycobacterium heckeshornense]KMV24240.1 crotonase [Mycobacterium heckeshornense]MCV7036476.1 enoyl-CoA hydratase/isomerase family protein [Mycobacterium heckeshornense]PIJ32701.1 crotonase [Mycobacterium heckeshornense]BCO34339.1 enoyl-CoA hydratase [Mycobacterium heckeshornense]BCQ07476.1 enoyl-CoA hydratase [Mycobacterium heckeshornense]